MFWAMFPGTWCKKLSEIEISKKPCEGDGVAQEDYNHFSHFTSSTTSGLLADWLN